MTTRSRKKSAGNGDDKQQAQTQPTKAKKPAFVSRYLGIDSHLVERNGSTNKVDGIASERPAGRKLAEDINRQCIQLDAEGYEVISIFPITSGRTAEMLVQSPSSVHGWTYTQQVEVQEDSYWGPRTRAENRYYRNDGVAYSVTDGVIITAKWRG